MSAIPYQPGSRRDLNPYIDPWDHPEADAHLEDLHDGLALPYTIPFVPQTVVGAVPGTLRLRPRRWWQQGALA